MRNLAVLIITILCYLHDCHLYAQQPSKKIVEQFKFTKIDSLIEGAISNVQNDTGILLIVSCKWNIGAHSWRNKNFEYIDNPYDIFIYEIRNGAAVIQKIDNYSFFRKQKVSPKKLKEIASFVNEHLDTMQNESFNSWVTYIEYDADSNMLIGRRSVKTAHKILHKVLIKKGDSMLSFEYNKDYDIDPENFFKYKYLFTLLLNKNERIFFDRIRKRQGIKYKIAASK